MVKSTMADETEQKESYIIIRFQEVGSVVLDIKFNDVTPLQVIAAAQFLELKGKNSLLQQENERMEKERNMSLAVPSGQNKVLIGR